MDRRKNVDLGGLGWYGVVIINFSVLQTVGLKDLLTPADSRCVSPAFSKCFLLELFSETYYYMIKYKVYRVFPMWLLFHL